MLGLRLASHSAVSASSFAFSAFAASSVGAMLPAASWIDKSRYRRANSMYAARSDALLLSQDAWAAYAWALSLFVV